MRPAGRTGTLAASVTLQTESGDGTLEQASPGDGVAKTGSGSVKLKNVRGGVEARTGSGEVEVNGDPTAAWEIHTGSGSITLQVPSQAGFDLDARSSSGSV